MDPAGPAALQGVEPGWCIIRVGQHEVAGLEMEKILAVLMKIKSSGAEYTLTCRRAKSSDANAKSHRGRPNFGGPSLAVERCGTVTPPHSTPLKVSAIESEGLRNSFPKEAPTGPDNGVPDGSSRREGKQFLSYCLYDDDDVATVPCCGSVESNALQSSAQAGHNRSFLFDGAESGDDSGAHVAKQELSLEDVFSFNLEHLEDNSGLEFDDLFSFDFDRVVAALRSGINLGQLQEIIEQSMTTNFDLMTADVTSAVLGDASPRKVGDLSGMMTPGRMTPRSPNSEESPGLVAQRLSKAPTPTRQHRFSVVQNHRLSMAVDEACTRYRQSLASAAAGEFQTQVDAIGEKGTMEEMTETIFECVRKSHKQNLHHLLQAVEVEVVGLSNDDGTLSECARQLQLVQQAVQGAQRSRGSKQLSSSTNMSS